MTSTIRLTVIEDGSSTVVELAQPVITIGRALDNHIRLRDGLASRHHARIERLGEELILVDVGSANGTQLNGKPIDRTALTSGDWILIGKTRIGVGDLDQRTEIGSVTSRLSVLPSTGQDTFVHEVTRERDNLLVLQRINRAINSEREISALFDLIVDSAITLTRAERGFLAVRAGGRVDEQGRPIEPGRLEFRVARNFAREVVPLPEEKLSRKIVDDVLANGRPIVSSDALSDERFVDFRSVADLELRSILAVPLRVREKTEGVIVVDNRMQKSVFGDDEIDLLESLADQAGIALANARVLEELRSTNRALADSRSQLEVRARELAGRVEQGEAALARAREEAAVARADLRSRYDYRAIVGESKAMRDLFRMLDRVVRADAPVLIVGESGTGKELVARAIHSNSSRSDRPFVSASCAAIQDTLLESELFGHAKGAFTGAHRAKKGLFELANGGTLFLDEVAEMSTEMQKSLLRALQEGEIRPIGAETAMPIDVRIICASQVELTQSVKAKTFREDLYYRLNVLPLRIPPLRERKEDIPLLVERFLVSRCREASVPLKKVDPGVLELFMTYPWPGNVRELENEVRRLVVLAADVVTPELVSDTIRDYEPDYPDDPELATDASTLPGRVRALEIRAIRSALTATRGNRSEAARRLGISRFALQRKVEKYGIEESGSTAAAE
ncbi:MAG: sigma 54-interacting transcriptional regulator [Planctomycetes bacterium]|nr:sigma 54-interacting transcriptional regulator [Planctomycetota bacterium]